jgi:hypothetical protein
MIEAIVWRSPGASALEDMGTHYVIEYFEHGDNPYLEWSLFGEQAREDYAVEVAEELLKRENVEATRVRRVVP